MNLSQKSKIANILTALTTVFVIAQTFLTTPPFTPDAIALWGAIFTYAVLVSTAWKQYLSPEVSNTAVKVTIYITIAATLTGLLSLVNIFHFSDQTSVTIKWVITSIVTLINILSKQLFPSQIQKENMTDLKRM